MAPTAILANDVHRSKATVLSILCLLLLGHGSPAIAAETIEYVCEREQFAIELAYSRNVSSVVDYCRNPTTIGSTESAFLILDFGACYGFFCKSLSKTQIAFSLLEIVPPILAKDQLDEFIERKNRRYQQRLESTTEKQIFRMSERIESARITVSNSDWYRTILRYKDASSYQVIYSRPVADFKAISVSAIVQTSAKLDRKELDDQFGLIEKIISTVHVRQ